VSLLALAFLGAVSVATAIPRTFQISGIIKDSLGNPVNMLPDVPIQVVYFADETTAQELATVLSASVGISSGYFSCRPQIPDALFDLDAVWYEIWIDTNLDGFDAGDRFDARFALNLSAMADASRPVLKFDTLGGNILFSTYYGGIGAGGVYLVPFTAPANGFSFNRCIPGILPPNHDGIINVGIYDSAGNRVAESGATFVSGRHRDESRQAVFELSADLQANQLYYFAITTSEQQATYLAAMPSLTYKPSALNVPVTAGTELPVQIADIGSKVSPTPVNAGLWLVEE
jgi:hypothetical protein